MSIAVAIVEDDKSVRQHLTECIQSSNMCTLVGSAENKHEALNLVAKDLADVYLIDLGLPDGNGIDVIAKIKDNCQAAQSLVLSSFGDSKHVLMSIQAGATGYLLKEDASSTLIEKIVALHNGVSPVSATVARMLVQQVGGGKNEVARKEAIASYKLSIREVEVLELLSEGLGVILIADRLHISTHTVNLHLRSIYRKLHVRSRGMAVHTATQNGILN